MGLRTPQGDQSCVSSRVSGLQEASLLLQLLFRLWELLATWARGSERMRYLWEGGGPWRHARPRRPGWTPAWVCGARPRGEGQVSTPAWGRGTYTISLGSSRVSGGGLMST